MFFKCREISYSANYHYLEVSRFGHVTLEIWRYGDTSDYTWVMRLKDLGCSDSELYDRIKYTGCLVVRTIKKHPNYFSIVRVVFPFRTLFNRTLN